MKTLKALITEKVFINLFDPSQEVSSFCNNWIVEKKILIFKKRIFKDILGFFQLWNAPVMETFVIWKATYLKSGISLLASFTLLKMLFVPSWFFLQKYLLVKVC